MNDDLLTARAIRWIIVALVTFTVYSVLALLTTLLVVSYLVSRFTAPPTLEYYPPPGQPLTLCTGQPLELTIHGLAHAIANRTEVSHTIYYTTSSHVALILPEPVPPFSGNPLAEAGEFEIKIAVAAASQLPPGLYTYSRTAIVYTGGTQNSVAVAVLFEVIECKP